MFTSAVKYRENDHTRVFGEQDGFQLAIAMIDIGTYNFDDLDGRELSEYLEITVKNYETSEDGGRGENLELHKCSDQEISFENSDVSKFHLASGEERKAIDALKTYFWCFDQSDLEIINDVDSLI